MAKIKASCLMSGPVPFHCALIGCLWLQSFIGCEEPTCNWLKLKKPVVSIFGQCAFTSLSLGAWGAVFLLVVNSQSSYWLKLRACYGIFLSFCVRVFNLKSCPLRLTFALYVVSFSSVYHNTDGWMLKVSSHSFVFITGTEKTDQTNLFNIWTIWAKFKLNLKSTWVCCKVILWNSSLWLHFPHGIVEWFRAHFSSHYKCLKKQQ